MYRLKDRKTLPLFPGLFPFGGKLNESNRWLRIAELIPWEELEEEYAKHFSDIGPPRYRCATCYWIITFEAYDRSIG